MSSNKLHERALIWLLLTSLVAAPPIDAQAKEITFALVKALPDSVTTARIVREPGDKGRTIILLRETTVDVATVASALSSLDRSLKADGEGLKNQVVITLHGARSLTSFNSDEQRRAEEYVSRLQNVKLQELPGFGPAKILVVARDTLAKNSGR